MSLAAVSLVLALMASEPLEDPALEARAQNLMREIRCVACENEPVSQSAAPIAEDMRDRIREMVGEGASDTEVRDWFEARYGAHALFRPRARGSGWLLWFAPFALLIAGAGIAFLLRSKKAGDDEIAPVDPDDHDTGAEA